MERHLKDPRTQRVFSFQAMYAGLSPYQALAIYAVIAYMDSVAGVYFPVGGMHAVPRALAGAAFEALSCEGLARVDFFLRRDGSVIVNEVNTMPGFTPTSMFPRLWAASGLDYPALVDRLVTTALARTPGLR